jgi:rhodanese-related sulfurtransferase
MSGAIHAPDSPVVEVDPEGAKALLAEGAFLLDVREDDEWVAGHAGEAVHIPMGQVADRLAEVPRDKVVLCICRAGGRSGAIAAALLGEGFDVRNVTGGMQAWAAAGQSLEAAAGGPGTVI